MATIIERATNGRRYILLGAGYGKWATARPNAFLGDLIPTEKKEDLHLLCIADAEGRVYWMHPDEARVVSVDGRPPAEVLA